MLRAPIMIRSITVHNWSQDSGKPSVAIWSAAGTGDSHLNEVAVVPVSVAHFWIPTTTSRMFKMASRHHQNLAESCVSPAELRLLLHSSLLWSYFLPDFSTPSESQLLQIAVNQGSQSESHGKLFWTIHNIMASHQMDVPMPKGSHLVLNVNDKDVSSQCAIKVCWTRGSREYTLKTAKVTENSDSYHWTTSQLAECMLLLQADLPYQVGRRPWAA